MGYVIHEKPRTTRQAIFISTGPFFLNTLVGFLIAFPSALQFKMGAANMLDYLLMYLAISIATHAFPSTVDAQALWSALTNEKETRWYTKIFVAPVVGLIYLGALGSFFWLDLIYAIGVTIGLPWLLLGILA